MYTGTPLTYTPEGDYLDWPGNTGNIGFHT